MEVCAKKIELLKRELGLEGVGFVLKSEWGSQNSNYRQIIKDHLLGFEKASPQVLTSISHCPVLGGYAWAQGELSGLGFDLERTKRVSVAVAERVQYSQQELSLSPSPGVFWTAKEAAFKALLRANQPRVVSEIELGNWQFLDSQIGTVDIINLQKFKILSAKGIWMAFQNVDLCLFVMRS